VSEPAAPVVAVRNPIAAEDQARSNFYALLGRLYASGPDAALLRAIAGGGELSIETSDDTARGLADAWRMLTAASAAMDPEAAAQEYVDLFVGVGRSEVSLHAAEYLRSEGGSVLAELRSELARLGLSRQAGVSLFEDHLAAVLETMRVLVAGGPGVEPRPLGEQSAFFARYVSSWVPRCCAAIIALPIANYYRRVAEFTGFFVAIERDSFAID
jgi:TorA maturation chaperone TorD